MFTLSSGKDQGNIRFRLAFAQCKYTLTHPVYLQYAVTYNTVRFIRQYRCKHDKVYLQYAVTYHTVPFIRQCQCNGAATLPDTEKDTQMRQTQRPMN